MKAARPLSFTRERELIVIYSQERSGMTSQLRDALVRVGFKVQVVAAFQDAAPWLLLHQDSMVLLFQPPRIDSIRRAVLDSIRHLAPVVRIVALVTSPSPDVDKDLARAGVILSVASEGGPAAVIEALRFAMARPVVPQSATDSGTDLSAD